MKKIFFCLWLLLPVSVWAQLTMPKVFSDNMILQRNQPVPVWGTASAGEKIAVKIANQVLVATAGAQGNWKTLLKPLKSGKSYEMEVSGEKGEHVHIQNIQAGEVWICAGQSNMNFMLSADKDGAQELQNLSNDNIREFRTDMPAGVLNPENSDHSKWVSAVGNQANTFSAVAYYFAKQIQKAEKVPVGIIVMACGNTRAESWTDTNSLRKYPALKPMLSYWQGKRNDADITINHLPGKFYNDVVLPIIPFAVKGVIWYQGESNTLPDNSGRTFTERTGEYKTLLSALISNWRSSWNNAALPFYLVQLPNYTDPSGDIQWAKIRQAQLETMKEVSRVSMAITIDLGDAQNIHPNMKKRVGERIAKLVLTKEYQRRLGGSNGPIIKTITVKGNAAILKFDYAGSGLICKNSSMLTGFEIEDAARPGIFKTANAIIKGKEVWVWAEGVNHPVAVRYAWSDNPAACLYNKKGLPASPFLIAVSAVKK